MKRTITLENGRKVDCGVKEFNALENAIKAENPKEITLSTVKLLMSSDKMMNDLVKEMKKIMDEDVRQMHRRMCRKGEE